MGDVAQTQEVVRLTTDPVGRHAAGDEEVAVVIAEHVTLS